MRIIGGKHRARKLMRVGKATTRESADMVKESIFNMLGGTLLGTTLDLFAGSGAYGLEALSRGSNLAYFVDHDKDAVKTIKMNAETLGEIDHVVIEQKTAERFLKTIPKDLMFDTVFIDPPYDMNIYSEVMTELSDHLYVDSIVVCESSKHVILSDQVLDLVKIKEKVYGIKRVTIYEKI
ncbi:MAG: 16S rRNA (guanine(966)-N(2))-methyltransferase RsmD [Acholeplasmataceae bacterium]|nr:16S rRNA (guanine(966)-N(2))-methyltransferase RsmD [Acholeplasmataceae bacterium]